MLYNTLGRSGLTVSRYALGTMTFGSETDETDAFAQLDNFVEQGGTMLDCADVYGGGAAESIVGRWLKARPESITAPVVLLTKGRFPVERATGAEGTSRRHLRRALDNSLRRLGTDHIDIYMAHSFDPLTPLEETLGFLDDAIRQGKISYCGLSNFLGWQVQKAAEVCRRNGFALPVTMQPSYSLLVREIEWEILPACLENGMGLMAWSPLGGGWLTGKYRRDVDPTGATRLGEDPSRGIEAYAKRAASNQTWEVLDVVHKIADDRGASMAQVALAWVAQKPGVSTVLVGARTQVQLKDNLGAAALTLTPEEMAILDRASAPQCGDWPYGPAGNEQRSRVLPGG
ncbi:aldo/keto reductase [Pseudarthrobacter sp. NPDC092439]|uniref:aldo/keto reductase n=1 Tax=unclassified Pseudarthrobacter TaxID=2647000 RepID=UPI00381EFFE9